MNSLTQNVLTIQGLTKGTSTYDELFTEIFLGVQASMDAIVNSYAYSLKGDVQAGESLAMEHIMVAIEKFQYKGYEFLTFYKKTLKNKMIDLVRTLNAEKVKHNTSYDVSLSVDVTDAEGSSYSVEDRFQDTSLQVVDTYGIEETLSISGLLNEYKAIKPVDAELVELSMMYSASNGFMKKDLAKAVADYFNEGDYTNKLQQRLSRSVKGFKKYATERGYQFNF